MTPALWWAYGGLALVGVLSLTLIRRLVEVHHLYIGMAVTLIPWQPAHWVGLVLMADDTVQHAVQAIDFLRGFKPRPDWSPVHELYVWAYRLIANTSDS